MRVLKHNLKPRHICLANSFSGTYRRLATYGSTSGRTNVKFVRLVDPSTAEIRDAGMDRFKELLA